MGGIAFTLLLAASAGQVPPPPAAVECGSFLAQPAYCEDKILRGPLRPYALQPGDIMLAADSSVFWTAAHKIALTSHPTHSAIVFRRPDGTIAILEAGPHDTMRIRTLDALPHLKSYEEEGRVWIRRRAVPLTREQSDCLTSFALRQDGKRFAIGRLGQQLLPIATRGPIRTFFIGKPHGDRNSYFCSELVTEAMVAAGLIDARTARPSATYPRDIFMDDSLNLYLKIHLKLAPCWDPPARWVSSPVECMVEKK